MHGSLTTEERHVGRYPNKPLSLNKKELGKHTFHLNSDRKQSVPTIPSHFRDAPTYNSTNGVMSAMKDSNMSAIKESNMSGQLEFSLTASPTQAKRVHAISEEQ